MHDWVQVMQVLLLRTWSKQHHFGFWRRYDNSYGCRWFVVLSHPIQASWRPFNGNQPLKVSKLVHMNKRNLQVWIGMFSYTFYAPFRPISLWWCSPRDNKIVPHWFITHKTGTCTIKFNPDHVCMLVYPPPNLYFVSHSISRSSLYYFLVVWHSLFVFAHLSICKLRLAAVVSSGRSNWETFLRNCMPWYAIFMMKYEYYVIDSSFLSVITVPPGHPTSVKCVVPFDDRMNGYDALRSWEMMKISVRSSDWLIVLSMLIVMNCLWPYGHVPTSRGLTSIMNSNQLCNDSLSSCGATAKMADFVMI